MLLREVNEQVFKLLPHDRPALVDAVIEYLQLTTTSQSDRSGAIRWIRGCLRFSIAAGTINP